MVLLHTSTLILFCKAFLEKKCKQIHIYINTGERFASKYMYTSIQGKELQAVHIYINTGERIASKYIYTSIQGKELHCKQIHIYINTGERIE